MDASGAGPWTRSSNSVGKVAEPNGEIWAGRFSRTDIRENAVGPTFSLLAAGLLVAQTAEPPVTPGKTCNCQKGATTTGYVQPVTSTPAPSQGPVVGRLFRGDSNTITDDRPSLFSRVQGLFKKNTPATEPATIEPPVEQPKPGLSRFMRMPAGQPTGQPAATQTTAPTAVPAAPVKTVQPVTYQATPATQTSGNLSIASSVTPPASRPNRISPDLVGKVGHETDYSWITGQLHIENGSYVIHYATPEVVDQHNGSLVLSTTQDLRGYQDGDFVSVRGTIAGGAGGRATYRLTGIDRLPR